ncbi:MAG: beta-propeller fold lactonase family protein [Bacteroidota bacterium]|nr:beta-propeller fold lactonase family protein [Bacteroidota bacterium]
MQLNARLNGTDRLINYDLPDGSQVFMIGIMINPECFLFTIIIIRVFCGNELPLGILLFSQRMKKISFLLIAIVSLYSFPACKSSHKIQGVSASSSPSRPYHSSYDDSSLLIKAGPIMMPYNRFIDPAGAVVRFGDSKYENHSLDCTLLPDGNVLAVEDRYGVAFIDVKTKQVLYHLDYGSEKENKRLMSTYSGIKAVTIKGEVHVFWSTANSDEKHCMVMDAVWDGKKAVIKERIDFAAVAPAPLSLPNDIAVVKEGEEHYLYVVLNGNSQLSKVRWSDKKTIWTAQTGMAPFGVVIAKGKAYVSNWAGPVPTDTSLETAGIPYANVYIDHRTGGTSTGTVSVFDLQTGAVIKEIKVGLHPNAVICSPDQNFVYVANGNSDNVNAIYTGRDSVTDTIKVRLSVAFNPYIGSSPNALAVSKSGTRLYVANGMDNALAVVRLGAKSSVIGKGRDSLFGYISTEAYPAGLALDDNNIYVSNLEGEGARMEIKNAYNAHHMGATVSIIAVPQDEELPALTRRVENANLLFRTRLSQLLPRVGVAAKPVPERIGEPSVIKHVVYIIKENRTYDQVMGDVKEGDGRSSLCIYGDSVTPNQHQLAKDFLLLDNYYASGKSSAEGHQWTDAAMTSDYVEKNVRAWFRSYPHVQNDALVYNKEGFIWNNALDHGKSVRIYGEACDPHWDEKNLGWKEIYSAYKNGRPVKFTNETTISRVRPILSENCPCADTHDFPDVMRADAFIKELKEYEKMDSDQWPQLIVTALSSDHTTGTRQGFPTPRAMVADNDLAVGKIIEAISHSRFWKNTAIFITEDDSQDGWDHVSAYRTTGFVVSPYAELHRTVHTNYNQTCMVRTIEQILGIPPMNVIDATALPMFDCFSSKADTGTYKVIANKIPLDEMNKDQSMLKGQELNYAILSADPQFDKLDGGNDDLLNRILWFAAKGKKAYPGKREKGQKIWIKVF